MGKQNKDVGCIGCFGWLLAVGLIVYIIDIIFLFIIKNLPIIMTVIFVALVLFMLIAFFQKKHKDLSKDFLQDNKKEFDVDAFARECNAYVIREERKEQNQIKNNVKEASITEAYAEIDRANKLADIANKTTDREEFYSAIAEIESILTELSKYEHKFGFSYPPSANLRDLRHGRDKQIELLEKRIEEKEATYHYQTDIQKVDTNRNNLIETAAEEPKPIKKRLVKRKSQRKYMSQYDIEQFAKECNAYIVHEERKERQEKEQREREEIQEKD